MSYKMFIDDLRTPPDETWILCKSSSEAIEYTKNNGSPIYVSLDHDLGEDDTTMIFLKWLIDRDIDTNGKFIPEKFIWNIHSANPVGRDNMNSLLSSYMNFKSSEYTL